MVFSCCCLVKSEVRACGAGHRHALHLLFWDGICFPGYRMCICHLSCRPVKPNLVGDQVKMLNPRNSCYCTKWGNWVAEGNFWDLLSLRIQRAALCDAKSFLVQDVWWNPWVAAWGCTSLTVGGSCLAHLWLYIPDISCVLEVTEDFSYACVQFYFKHVLCILELHKRLYFTDIVQDGSSLPLHHLLSNNSTKNWYDRSHQSSCE